MARCKSLNILTRFVTPLPLLIVNKKFRSLDSMQDSELESFVRYLVRFTSEAEEWDQDIKPLWWGHGLKFPQGFCSRNRRIPFVKNKLVEMRSVIYNCYIYYDQIELLQLSERLANIGPIYFLNNQNDTVTIYRADRKVPLVVVPASNLMYEAAPEFGAMMNVNVTQRLASVPVKNSRRSLLHWVQFVESDIENGEDCIPVEQSQFSVKENPRSAVDLTNNGNNDFVAQCSFLNLMGVMGVNENPPEPPSEPLRLTDRDKRMGIPLKVLNACDVPFLVKMGVLPKACLADKEDIRRYTRLIDAHSL